MNVKRFIRLNAWAFVLDALALVPMIGLFFVMGVLSRIALAIAALVIGIQALKLHGHYGDRERMLTVLLERNRPVIRMDTFVPFMKAPCGRMIVKQTLEELGSDEMFCRLKADVPFASLAKAHGESGLEIVPYSENEGNHDELRAGGIR